jgi:hypothetical protein
VDHILVKIAVFFLAVTLAIVILMIIRRRINSFSGNSAERLTKTGRLTWQESLQDLTLAELERKLIELKRENQEASLGFLQMSPLQQQNAIAQVSKISKKIEIVKSARDKRFKST